MSSLSSVFRALARHGCTPDSGVQHHKLALDAAHAFAKRQFSLRHETVFSPQTGRILYHETLCSLHSNGHPLRIDRALKALERWGAGLAINLFIINEALAAQKHNARLGRIGLNLPPNLLATAAARRKLLAVFNRYRVNGRFGHIVLELVETSPLPLSKPVINWLQKLRNDGMRIALDDFGARKGHHTLAHAALDVVDIIKLDGDITQKLIYAQPPSWWKKFVLAAQRPGVSLVAEHTATPAEALYLSGYNIHYVQSRHLTPAMFKR